MRWLRVFAGVKRISICSLIFFLELLVSLILFVAAKILITTHWSGWTVHDVHIAGAPAVHPHFEFACEQPTDSLQTMFANADIVSDLRAINAGVSLALIDLSRDRAKVVQQLNSAAVPVTAWLVLPKWQGYYLNTNNAAAARARFAEFEKWTAEYGLRWVGVGLDIEPSLQEFGAIRADAKWRIAATLIRRCFDSERVLNARYAYSALIKEIQARGYPVDTYQFPFIADERKVRSTLLERMFGIVDVRGNREVLMLYSSFNHAADSGLLWEYGPDAGAIAIGTTSGDSAVPAEFGPLNWTEFSRDLIVASRFTRVVGIYSLEGCVQRGYLARLRSMNWAQPVTIEHEGIRTVALLRTRIQAVLWMLSHVLYIAAAVLVLDACAWLIWRQRVRKRVPTNPDRSS